jgi:hypothetical protein
MMSERAEGRRQWDADVDAVRSLGPRYVEAFDNMRLAMETLDSLELNDDEKNIESEIQAFNRAYAVALEAGDALRLDVNTFIAGLATPESNGRLFSKHSIFYEVVPQCLRRLVTAFDVYAYTFRVYFEADDLERFDLIHRVWRFISDTYVVANILYLRDLPVIHKVDMAAAADLDKTLEGQSETLAELNRELLVALPAQSA